MFTTVLLSIVLVVTPPQKYSLNIIKKLLPRTSHTIPRDTTRNFIVIHNDGYSSQEKSVFKTLLRRKLSYHYFIGQTGKIYQFRDLKFTAQHAGISNFLGMIDWNVFSIGICLQGQDNTEYTNEQYASLHKLIVYIHNRYPDSINKQLVFHQEIAVPFGRKTDPGIHFDISRISF